MNSAQPIRPLLADAERIRLLDQLDSVECPRGLTRRKSARLEYRLRAVMTSIEHLGGGKVRHASPTRNICTGGMSLLIPCFLHRGTKVVVNLRACGGKTRACAGAVSFCRFLGARVHEIGVTFTERIEISDFCEPGARVTSTDIPEEELELSPLTGGVTVVSPRAAERVLVVARLRQCGLDAVGVETTGAAIDRVKRLGAAAVVVDTALPADQQTQVMDSLSELCGTLPLVAMIYPRDEQVSRRALQTGMSACLDAPLARTHVHEVMKRVLSGSMGYYPSGGGTSGGSGEPQNVDMVRFFLSHVAESTRKIEEAIKASDIGELRRVCEALSSIAPGYGFRAVGFAARESVASLNGSASVEESKPRLRALLSMCYRLITDSERPAHDDAPLGEAAGGATSPEALTGGDTAAATPIAA